MNTNFIKNNIVAAFVLMSSLVGISANAQTVQQAVPAQTDLNIRTINNIIEEIIADSIPYDQTIKEVRFAINPQSNIKQGNIGAKFAALTGTAPWAQNEDGEVIFEIGSQFKDLNETYKDGLVKAKFQVKTDTLAMIRYFSNETLQKQSGSTDPSLDLLKKLAQVTDVHSLYLIALEIKDYALKTTKNAETLEFINSIAFSVRTTHNKVQAFKMEATKNFVFNFFETKIELRRPSITASADSFTIALGLATMTEKAKFEAFTERALKDLLSLQNREERALKDIKRSVADWASTVRDFLKN